MKSVLPILFNNSDFVVVNKPAGILSVPSRMGKSDPRPVVGLILQEQLSAQLFPVHRLDFEVSGILLFAKTQAAHTIANRWFEQKIITKTYCALTSGIAPAVGQHMEWKSKILRGKKRAYESPVGKESLTKAQFLGLQSSYLKWQLQPITGRAHQLRFDLSRHGFPIVGDKLYGSGVSYLPEQIALRAFSLQFPAEAQKFNLPNEIVIASDFQIPDES